MNRKSENVSRLLKICLWMNVPAKLPPPSGTPSLEEGELFTLYYLFIVSFCVSY